MREEILEGKLDYPGFAILIRYPEQMDDIRAFWRSLWTNYLAGGESNGVYWYDILGHKLYNELVRGLSHHGWIESHVLTGRKWLSAKINEDKLLTYVDVDELTTVRVKYKYSKYLLERKESKSSKLVRQNGKTKRTGLVREGFRDSGNTEFGYDAVKLRQYESAVVKNLTKSMDKIRDSYPEMQSEDYDYDKVCVGIYDCYVDNPYETYTTGQNINDSRGRAVSKVLGKVMNPISSKDARASLVITYD